MQRTEEFANEQNTCLHRLIRTERRDRLKCDWWQRKMNFTAHTHTKKKHKNRKIFYKLDVLNLTTLLFLTACGSKENVKTGREKKKWFIICWLHFVSSNGWFIYPGDELIRTNPSEKSLSKCWMKIKKREEESWKVWCIRDLLRRPSLAQSVRNFSRCRRGVKSKTTFWGLFHIRSQNLFTLVTLTHPQLFRFIPGYLPEVLQEEFLLAWII